MANEVEVVDADNMPTPSDLSQVFNLELTKEDLFDLVELEGREALKRQIVDVVARVQALLAPPEWSATPEEARAKLDDAELMQFAKVYGEYIVPVYIQTQKSKAPEELTVENFDRIMHETNNTSSNNLNYLFATFQRRNVYDYAYLFRVTEDSITQIEGLFDYKRSEVSRERDVPFEDRPDIKNWFEDVRLFFDADDPSRTFEVVTSQGTRTVPSIPSGQTAIQTVYPRYSTKLQEGFREWFVAPKDLQQRMEQLSWEWRDLSSSSKKTRSQLTKKILAGAAQKGDERAEMIQYLIRSLAQKSIMLESE